ncbi:MAG: PAS domain-containing protein [Eubacterium sp.]|nr:PAS domain-containing protein [Eubacterium sp.]
MDNNAYEEILRDIQELLFIPGEKLTGITSESPEDFIAENEYLMSVIENIPNGVTILSPDFRVRYINRVMRKWFMNNRRNYKVKCYSLFHNGQKHHCENCPALATLDTKGSASTVHECGRDEKTGEPLFMHIHTMPILNKKGQVSVIIEYSYNLTEQRRMQKSVEKWQTKCSLLEQENLLLKKALSDSRSDMQRLETTVNENMENYVRPAMEYLKTRIDPDEHRIFSSMIEESVFAITKKRNSRMAELSTREIQVAMLIKEGYSSQQIADELFLTKKAVDYHRTNIRKKLEIDSKANLQVVLSMYL